MPKVSTGKISPQVFTVSLMFSKVCLIVCSENVLAVGNINTLHVYIVFLPTKTVIALDS